VLTQETLVIIILSLITGGFIFPAVMYLQYLQACEEARRLRADLASLRALMAPEGATDPLGIPPSAPDVEHRSAEPVPSLRDVPDDDADHEAARVSASVHPDLAKALVKAIAGPDTETPARAVISGVQEEIEAVAELCKSAVETEAQVLVAPLESYARRLEVGLRMLRREGGAHPPPPDADPPSSSDSAREG
jgi:hypothetical protein